MRGFAKTLLELPGTVYVPSKVYLYGVYKGRVKFSDREKGVYFVDVGSETLFLPYSKVHTKTLLPGEEVVVQVEDIPWGNKKPVATTNITFPGEKAVLIPGNRVLVSKKIVDMEKRGFLIALGMELRPEGWGILWRTISGEHDEAELRAEVKRLVELVELVNRKKWEASAPCLLHGEIVRDRVLFSSPTFSALDRERGFVTPTLRGHHQLKSPGYNLDLSLATLEQLILESPELKEKLEKHLEESMKKFLWPKPGESVLIEHQKLDGTVLYLGRAVVKSVDDKQLLLERKVHTDGVYNGLGVPKRVGDLIETLVQPYEWWTHTRYLRQNQVVGEYVNINTPAEVCPDRIRYIDLEVDVIRKPGGEIEIVDKEKLEKHRDITISSKLVETALKKAEEAVWYLGGGR
ncbi:MAG: hypothetical protein DRO11_09725 [Methanobacteriota archaeon]|nr:MAG: hypothetical protein DRO11_09725 [Euryarchaeota archaeon]